ncbi:unnamed protein product, partial [Prorocentrum cordatum]
VEDDQSVKHVLSLQLVSLLRQQAFVNLDLRAEYFVANRKVEMNRGQDRVKAIKKEDGEMVTNEEEIREE